MSAQSTGAARGSLFEMLAGHELGLSQAGLSTLRPRLPYAFDAVTDNGDRSNRINRRQTMPGIGEQEIGAPPGPLGDEIDGAQPSRDSEPKRSRAYKDAQGLPPASTSDDRARDRTAADAASQPGLAGQDAVAQREWRAPVDAREGANASRNSAASQPRGPAMSRDVMPTVAPSIKPSIKPSIAHGIDDRTPRSMSRRAMISDRIAAPEATPPVASVQSGVTTTASADRVMHDADGEDHATPRAEATRAHAAGSTSRAADMRHKTQRHALPDPLRTPTQIAPSPNLGEPVHVVQSPRRERVPSSSPLVRGSSKPAPAPEPVIEIHIGRVDVRAQLERDPPAANRASPPREAAAPDDALASYLARRNGGARS